MSMHISAPRRQKLQPGAYHPLRLIFSAQLWKAAAYLILSFPLGVLWFYVIVFLIALSVGTSIIWVGVLIFALAVMLWRIGAGIERWRLAVFMDRMVPSPYQPLPEGSWLRRLWTRASDIAVWRDLLYLLLLFPLGVVDLISVLAGVIAPISLITMPLYFWFIPQHGFAGFSHLWSVLNQVDSLPKALLAAFIGLLWLISG
ncbi:MAG TPA: sensor domain-containing protein, partial [Ktedonobacterales bacterium]|nr:sensor domain-containing protein [Ktedonobacterales bacterium]